MPERMEFDVTFGRSARPRGEEDPMRLLVLGDFSGRPGSERPALASRPTTAVDVDTLDTVMRRFAPRLRLPAGEIEFAHMDDFHPDRLFARLDRFKSLRTARADPASSGGDALLGQLIGKPADANSPQPSKPAGGLEALIHDIVAPHIVKDTTEENKPLVAAIDTVLTEEMRALLHNSAFQSLEAAWRGVQWLVSRLELNETLQLHLFDVTRDELLADIASSNGKVGETAIYRALVDRWRNVPGGQGWTVIAALMEFGPANADVALLAALGLIGAEAGAPLIAGADWALTTATEDTLEAWNALRRNEVAKGTALAAPRLLLRGPYGKRSDPIEAFAFEEVDGAPARESLLWGSGSLALLLSIGASFAAHGWDMELGDEREIADLPAYTYERDGEMQLQSAGEYFLTERQIGQLLDAGIVPIASHRGRNVAVVVRFQSIAHPLAPLAW